MKKHTVAIGQIEFPLAFTLQTMIWMEHEIEGFDFSKINEIAANPESMVDMLYLMARTGAALEERKLEKTKEWMALHIPASFRRISEIQIAMMDTMSDGMGMETEEEDDEEVDVVLEEIKKKEAKDG